MCSCVRSCAHVWVVVAHALRLQDEWISTLIDFQTSAKHDTTQMSMPTCTATNATLPARLLRYKNSTMRLCTRLLVARDGDSQNVLPLRYLASLQLKVFDPPCQRYDVVTRYPSNSATPDAPDSISAARLLVWCFPPASC